MTEGLRLWADAFGDPAEVCRLERAPLAPPPVGKVRVRMILSPINPSDLLPIRGAYPSRLRPPFIPGFEGVGIAAGGDYAGRRVLPLGGPGLWASHVDADPDWLIPVPDACDDAQAATAYVNPLTAWRMLETLALPAGAWLGLSAAGSAIGRMLVRLAARRGLRVLALARDPRHVEPLTADGAEIVSIGDRIPPRWDGALHGALDCVGGATGAALLQALAPQGQGLHYGLLSGVPLPGDLARHLAPGARFGLFRLRDWVHAVGPAERRAAFADLFPLILNGVCATDAAPPTPLSAWREVFRAVDAPERRQKLLFNLND